VADDAQEPIVEARSTLSLDIERWIWNTGMHHFWLEMPPFIPGRRWAARLQLAGVKSLLQWWGDRLPLYCVERAVLHLWGCSHKLNNIFFVSAGRVVLPAYCRLFVFHLPYSYFCFHVFQPCHSYNVATV
jgi:hypothetical protein